MIALIQSLQQFAAEAFQRQAATAIPNAWAVIDGEPVNLLTDSELLIAQGDMPSSNA